MMTQLALVQRGHLPNLMASKRGSTLASSSACRDGMAWGACSLNGLRSGEHPPCEAGLDGRQVIGALLQIQHALGAGQLQQGLDDAFV